MSTVYLVQEPLKRDARTQQVIPRFNMSTLEEFGQTVCLCSWGELRNGFDGALLMRKMREKLDTFCDQDFIVPVGNPALIGLAILVAADVNEGRVRMLDWIRDEGRYREVRVDMEWAALDR